MNDSTMDAGLIEVLLERLEKQRLPRLLEIKEKVDGGHSLDNFDVDYLEKAMEDGRSFLPVIDRYPEYQSLAAKVMDLYKSISEKALEIEKNS